MKMTLEKPCDNTADSTVNDREKQPHALIEIRAKSEQRLYNYTTAAVKDELTYQLSSAAKYNIKQDKDTGAWYIEDHLTCKYHDRAEFVLARINIWNASRPPVFVIDTSDLSLRLRNELDILKETSPIQFERIVTEAVQTLMEGINQRYYHIAGLPYKVTWRFEE
jgi:hypothetical protein